MTREHEEPGRTADRDRMSAERTAALMHGSGAVSKARMVCGQVYRTSDLEQFKTLPGNRNVTDERHRKVKESISQKYIPIPIVVNEKMEVIDGQARLEVCRELGLEIYFVVCKDLGQEDCVLINTASTNWLSADFVSSYAQVGVKDYERAEDLMNRFNVSLDEVRCAASTSSGSPELRRQFKAGNFSFTESDYLLAQERLLKAEEVLTALGGQITQKKRVREAIFRCCKTEGYDHKRMVKACREHSKEFRNSPKMTDVLKEMGRIYNIGKRKDFMDVYGEGKQLKVSFNSPVNRMT